jgi:hypothetical protein
MAKRRDVFILVPAPGRKEDATRAIADWLEQLDGYPGFLGGSILYETANELIEDTIVLITDFDSTASSRATYEKLEASGLGWAFEPNGKGPETEDQGWALYPDGAETRRLGTGAPLRGALDLLSFDRGNGALARLLHVHAEVAYEHTAPAGAARQNEG